MEREHCAVVDGVLCGDQEGGAERGARLRRRGTGTQTTKAGCRHCTNYRCEMFNLSPQCTGGNTLFRHPSYQTARPTRPTRPIELSHQTVLSNRALKCVKFLQYCDSLMPEMVGCRHCTNYRCEMFNLSSYSAPAVTPFSGTSAAAFTRAGCKLRFPCTGWVPNRCTGWFQAPTALQQADPRSRGM